MLCLQLTELNGEYRQKSVSRDLVLSRIGTSLTSGVTEPLAQITFTSYTTWLQVELLELFGSYATISFLFRSNLFHTPLTQSNRDLSADGLSATLSCQ